MNRVVVIGSSGSGKTTLARQLAAALALPHLELDSVAHDGGLNATPKEEFRRRVGEFITRERWILDGNYTSWGSRDVVWPRADTIVWLDLPKRVVTWGVVTRTLRRVATQEELWNGVREPWTNLYSLDPHENIILWSWTNFEHTREKYETAMRDGTWAHARVHRLTSRRQVDALVAWVGG